MTTLQNRPNTALIVIDMQNAVVANAHRRDEVIENIRIAVDRAADAGTSVGWVQHSDDDLVRDSEEWRYVAELYWAHEEAPGRTASVVSTVDVRFD